MICKYYLKPRTYLITNFLSKFPLPHSLSRIPMNSAYAAMRSSRPIPCWLKRAFSASVTISRGIGSLKRQCFCAAIDVQNGAAAVSLSEAALPLAQQSKLP